MASLVIEIENLVDIVGYIKFLGIINGELYAIGELSNFGNGDFESQVGKYKDGKWIGVGNLDTIGSEYQMFTAEDRIFILINRLYNYDKDRLFELWDNEWIYVSNEPETFLKKVLPKKLKSGKRPPYH
ncbi:MAG TPA: hypothetical protein PKX15_00340 [Bacteroidales bacterium]|nr:hypothetical protein [Bacteroidales bacterium]